MIEQLDRIEDKLDRLLSMLSDDGVDPDDDDAPVTVYTLGGDRFEVPKVDDLGDLSRRR